MNAAQHERPRDGVPLGVLLAAAAMITFAIVASLYSRSSGVGRVEMQDGAPYQVLQLAFEDQPNGAVNVRDASRGDVIYVVGPGKGGYVIYVVGPGKGGFVRATLRTLAQARMRDNIGPETPFRLTRWSDGTVSLDDPTTGRAIGLDAFGADNAGAFAQLFKKREETK
jgi:putative photosynthetic complex assembly protein